MMESMRNLAKTYVAKILLGLLVAAFGVWGIQGVGSLDSAFSFAGWITGFGARDMANVGGIPVNADLYNKRLQDQLRNLSAQTKQNLTLDDAKKFGLDRQILDDLINSTALLAVEKKLNLKVGLPVIQKDMAEERAFHNSKGVFDPAVFRAVLERNGLSEGAYLANQMQMRSRAATLSVASGELALPKVLAQALNQYQGETRDAKFVVVSVKDTDITKPSAADLEAQYKKTPQAYTAPEYRSMVAMSVTPETVASKLQVSADEVTAGYEKYKTDYFVPETRDVVQLSFPTLDAAEKGLVRLKAGEDVMKIATELKKTEADVKFTGKTKSFFIDPKVGEAAFATPEGQVSNPVSGALATVLVKVTKVSPEKQSSLDEVKEKLTKRLQLDKARDEITTIYQAVEDARADKMKFEDIAAKQGLSISNVAAVSATGQDPSDKQVDLPAKAELLQAVFGSEVGDENDPLSIDDGFVWYDVRGVTPSALKPLEQVKDQVTGDVMAERARTAAADKAKALAAAAKGGKTIDAIALENGAEVKTVTALKRNQQSADFDGSALAAAFSVPEQGFATSLEGDGKSARVIQVIKVTLPPVMATSPELKQSRDETMSAFGNDLQTAFVKALRKDVGVKINTELWQLNNPGSTPPTE